MYSSRPMDSFGYHALCCPGRTMNHRHDLVANALSAIAHDAGFTVLVLLAAVVMVLSRPGITVFRPADILLHLGGPRRTCVDTTVVSPVVAVMPVHFRPDAAAFFAEEAKYNKHFAACEAAGDYFKAFAVDVFGVLAPDASALVNRFAA